MCGFFFNIFFPTDVPNEAVPMAFHQFNDETGKNNKEIQIYVHSNSNHTYCEYCVEQVCQYYSSLCPKGMASVYNSWSEWEGGGVGRKG